MYEDKDRGAVSLDGGGGGKQKLGGDLKQEGGGGGTGGAGRGNAADVSWRGLRFGSCCRGEPGGRSVHISPPTCWPPETVSSGAGPGAWGCGLP